MLRGLATVTLLADDVPAAARWYAGVLDAEPYFARPVEGPPVYVEFRIGDDEDELGIMDARYATWTAGQPAGVVVHWHVDDLPAALEHMAQWGSGHSEAIVADSARAIADFTAGVDAAAVLVNASTRFTDGGEVGFGAEIGISTQKLHARGPIGLRELCSTRYLVEGSGQVRA